MTSTFLKKISFALLHSTLVWVDCFYRFPKIAHNFTIDALDVHSYPSKFHNFFFLSERNEKCIDTFRARDRDKKERNKVK